MPEVRVETDDQNRGTPYRTCSIAVYVDDLNIGQMDRVRFALSKVVQRPEVSVIAKGRPTPVDSRRFVRLRVVYYGEQAPAEKVEKAVRDVL